jgi:uncharacterized membrane protein
MASGEAHPETRRMMETAIRRLNVLEYLILGVAMALALLAGALAAWLVGSITGAPFRLTWALSSLLFFAVPGWIVLKRERQSKRQAEGAQEGVDGTAVAAPPELLTEKRDDGGR